MTPKAKVPKASRETTPVSETVMELKKPKQKQKNATKDSGLTFNVYKTHQKLKKGHYAKQIRGKGAAIYMTGVLEYLVAEVLELAGDVAKRSKKKRIIPRHIMLAVRGDEELNQMFGDVDFASSGSIPYIHDVLLPKRTSRKSTQSSMETNTESY